MAVFSRLAIVAALLVTVGGCSSPTRTRQERSSLIVTAFLTPGSGLQVKLRQTIPPEGFWSGREDTVRQAQVEVTVDGQTVVLAEAPDEAGTYRAAAAAAPVAPGKTYQLWAEHAGRQVRALTTVPFPATVHAATDTITYYARYGDQYGQLSHPGQFDWSRSGNAAGYVVIVEAVDVSSLPLSAEPVTADLDSLLARRERLPPGSAPDSIAALDQRIEALRAYLSRGISLIGADGDTARWLRDREQQDWDQIDGKPWSEGRRWRERRELLSQSRAFEYWISADSLRSDYMWMGVRFAGEYRLRLQAADRNYFDYACTYQNGASGSDSDQGPLFHVSGGTGVFGSYAEDTYRVWVRRGEDGPVLKAVRQQ